MRREKIVQEIAIAKREARHGETAEIRVFARRRLARLQAWLSSLPPEEQF
jgi:hypothetical protein